MNSGYVHGVGDAQAVLSHVLDMLGPGIDEGHVLAGLHHMGAGIAADRARSDDRENCGSPGAKHHSPASSREYRAAMGQPVRGSRIRGYKQGI